MRNLERFSAELRSVCPGMMESFDASANGSSLCRATDVLVVLYEAQNRVIHREITEQCPGLSLAECELRWIELDGPRCFFDRTKCFHPEIFREDLYGAFNALQALLLLCHFRHLHWILGRNPSKVELLNEEWFLWTGRLRRRFEPIFP